MKFSLIFISALIISTFSSFGQDVTDTSFTVTETLHESSGLFASDDLFSIDLKFDITEYKKKKDDKEYMDALISYETNGDSVVRKIRIRARGEFRRKFCEMPPIMLNFDMDDTATGDFHQINKLKMVTVCPTGSQEYLLKEYLTYKLYSVLTDNSFRVRLLKVNYLNHAKNDKSITEYAFVIEPVELLAKRIESVEIKTQNLTQKDVKPEMMNRVAIFNYMIGNTDWSVPIGHNVQLFAQYKSDHPELAAIVPYDFDFSGIVNTHYAAPFHTLTIDSVRERLYLGVCRDRETFIKALSEFAHYKNRFYSVINDFRWLDERSKSDMIYYLDGFFEDLAKPETLARTLLRECLKF